MYKRLKYHSLNLPQCSIFYRQYSNASSKFCFWNIFVTSKVVVLRLHICFLVASDVIRNLDPEIKLVSIMLANSTISLIKLIVEVRTKLHERGVLFYNDAVRTVECVLISVWMKNRQNRQFVYRVVTWQGEDIKMIALVSFLNSSVDFLFII